MLTQAHNLFSRPAVAHIVYACTLITYVSMNLGKNVHVEIVRWKNVQTQNIVKMSKHKNGHSLQFLTNIIVYLSLNYTTSSDIKQLTPN